MSTPTTTNDDAVLDLRTIQQVAERLGVGRSTVEEWVYKRDLASFKKGGVRKISRESLVRFVMLNTIKPKRPDWLTAQLESDFRKMLGDIIATEVRNQFTAEAQRRAA